MPFPDARTTDGVRPLVVVALDSFKGCLSSEEACRGAALGAADAGASAVEIAVADGGEGTLDRIAALWPGARIEETETLDALMRPVRSRMVLTPDGRAAVDFASTVGLPMLRPDERAPMLTSSYGVGLCIREAIRRGARSITVALGGSSTNDAALGLAQALGARLVAADGRTLPPGASGKDLGKIAEIDLTDLRRATAEVKFSYLFDAAIPFSGPGGAALLYAPQKGGDAAKCAALDEGMRRLGTLFAAMSGAGVLSADRGAGAAGGAGGGLAAMLGAQPERGIAWMLDAAGFDALLPQAALVLAGEGRSDAQTLQGKAAAGVLERARRVGVPVVLLAGRVEDEDALRRAGFCDAVDINASHTHGADPMNPVVASARLRRAAARAVRGITLKRR